jgi:hypothetical protein
MLPTVPYKVGIILVAKFVLTEISLGLIGRKNLNTSPSRLVNRKPYGNDFDQLESRSEYIELTEALYLPDKALLELLVGFELLAIWFNYILK